MFQTIEKAYAVQHFVSYEYGTSKFILVIKSHFLSFGTLLLVPWFYIKLCTATNVETERKCYLKKNNNGVIVLCLVFLQLPFSWQWDKN